MGGAGGCAGGAGAEDKPGRLDCSFNIGNASKLYTTAAAKMMTIRTNTNMSQSHFLDFFGFFVVGFSSFVLGSGMFSGIDSDFCCCLALARSPVAGGVDVSGLNLTRRTMK